MLVSCTRLTLAVVCVALWAFAQGHGEERTGGRSLERTWTNATGKYKIVATLEGVEDGKATLRKEDGTTVTVPLEKLSAADRRWIERNARPAAPKATSAGEAQAAESGWPGFRGPRRDGKSPDTGLLRQWPAGGPKLLWKTSGLGAGWSSVAVVDGTVYITGDVRGKLTLFALDMEGKRKWQVDCGPGWTGDWPGARATPTIDDGHLYLLSGVGNLLCLDAHGGARQWSRSAKEFGGSPGSWGYAESVLILGKLAIFKPGGQNCIVALDKTTGRDVWASRGFAAGPEYSSCLAFVNDGIGMIVTGTREGIVCVNADNGALLWGNRFSAGNTANCTTPAYSNGYVFWANGYGKGGICFKLNRGSASETWNSHDMVTNNAGYLIHDGFIYGSNDTSWVCLELKSGKTMWKERGIGRGSLCWADGMLYLYSEKGLAALANCSPEGLQLKGRLKVEGEGNSWAYPVVTGGRLYLRYDENLYCFDVKAQ